MSTSNKIISFKTIFEVKPAEPPVGDPALNPDSDSTKAQPSKEDEFSLPFLKEFMNSSTGGAYDLYFKLIIDDYRVDVDKLSFNSWFNIFKQFVEWARKNKVNSGQNAEISLQREIRIINAAFARSVGRNICAQKTFNETFKYDYIVPTDDGTLFANLPTNKKSFQNDDAKNLFNITTEENKLASYFALVGSINTKKAFYINEKKKLKATIFIRNGIPSLYGVGERSITYNDTIKDSPTIANFQTETMSNLTKLFLAAYKQVNLFVEIVAKMEKSSEKEPTPPVVAGGGGKPATPTPPTKQPLTSFTLFNHEPDNFVKGYQSELLKFSKNHNLTKAALKTVEEKGEMPKLSDGKYGHRTHYVTIQAVKSFKEAVQRAISNLEPQPQPPPPPTVQPDQPSATNENNTRRIETLAKLLNKKLNKIERNFLFEAEDPAQVEKLKKLLDTLNNLENKFTSTYNKGIADIPPKNVSMDKAPIEEFLKFLQMVNFDNNGNIVNIKDVADDVAKEKESEKKVPEKGGGAVTTPPKGDPKKDAALLYDASCWYNVDITIKGNPMTGPEGIWGAINDNKTFEMWYKNISKALEYEGYPDDYSFFVGPRVGYRSLVNLLYSRKDQSINLRCFINLFGRFADHLLAQLTSAQDYYSRIKVQNPQEADAFLKKMKPYYLNDSGKFEGSVFHQAYLELNDATTIKVQAMIKRLINAANNAENAGDQKAAGVLSNVASGKPLESAAAAASKGTGTREDPFKSEEEWAEWHRATSPTQRASKSVFFLFMGPNNNPLVREMPYDKDGDPVINKLTGVKTGTKEDPISDAAFQKAKQEPDLLKGRTVYVAAGGRVIEYVFDANGKQAKSQDVGPAPKPMEESLKQKREWLLHEALFKKLVR